MELSCCDVRSNTQNITPLIRGVNRRVSCEGGTSVSRSTVTPLGQLATAALDQCPPAPWHRSAEPARARTLRTLRTCDGGRRSPAQPKRVGEITPNVAIPPHGYCWRRVEHLPSVSGAPSGYRCTRVYTPRPGASWPPYTRGEPLTRTHTRAGYAHTPASIYPRAHHSRGAPAGILVYVYVCVYAYLLTHIFNRRRVENADSPREYVANRKPLWGGSSSST